MQYQSCSRGGVPGRGGVRLRCHTTTTWCTVVLADAQYHAPQFGVVQRLPRSRAMKAALSASLCSGVIARSRFLVQRSVFFLARFAGCGAVSARLWTALAFVDRHCRSPCCGASFAARPLRRVLCAVFPSYHKPGIVSTASRARLHCV